MRLIFTLLLSFLVAQIYAEDFFRGINHFEKYDMYGNQIHVLLGDTMLAIIPPEGTRIGGVVKVIVIGSNGTVSEKVYRCGKKNILGSGISLTEETADDPILSATVIKITGGDFVITLKRGCIEKEFKMVEASK